MLLHLSKVAVGCASLDALVERMAGRALNGVVVVDTRYRPTRHAELIGGSLYWIVKHRLVARQTILDFAEDESRKRCLISVDARLMTVLPQPRRAHQGWRYLADADAPSDIAGGAIADLPPHLLRELAALALV